MTELKILKENDNFQEFSNKITDVSYNIPFGNSKFQNTNTVIGGQNTPHRGLRSALLRIQNRTSALNELKFSLRENEIKIERAERKIERLEKEKPIDYDLDIDELKIEIEKILSNENSTKKLANDAIIEINDLLPIVNKIGKIDRETFESLEGEHFKRVYLDNLSNKSEGLKGLEQMGYRIQENGKLELTEKSLNNMILETDTNLLLK